MEFHVLAGDRVTRTVPVERAVSYLAQALRENGGDEKRAVAALMEAFEALKRKA